MKERILNTIGSKQTIWMPMILFAASFVFYLWLVWERVPGILGDQGWYLQVSRRVAAGEILYRDVLWSYGPLPVYLMSWLMQHGNEDIAFYSIIHASAATLATMILYRLHRFWFSPHHAALGAILIMLLGGTYLTFLYSYTTAITLGALCALATFLGLMGSLKSQAPYLNALFIAFGLSGALLSKQEFGFGAAIICCFVIFLSLRSYPICKEPKPSIGSMVIGMIIGLLIAIAFYGVSSIQLGWQPILESVTGYQIFQVAGTKLILYTGSASWVYIITASSSLLILILWVYTPAKFQNLAHRKLVHRTCLVGFLLYLLFLVAWQTGWLSDVRHQKLSILDVAVLIHRLLTHRGLIWFFQVHLAKIFLLGIVLLLVILAPRWTKRIQRRQTISSEHLACLTGLVFALIIELRFALFGTYLLQPVVLMPIISTMSSELPQVEILLKQATYRTQIILGIVLAGIINFIAVCLPLANTSTYPFSSVYGQVHLDPFTYSLINESVQYIKSNSQPEDYIAVIGPLPGIYYLSERKNPFRQDYLSVFVGNSEEDASDYLERLERFKPSLLIVLQGSQNYGLLNLRGGSENSGVVHSVGRRLFGDAASQVEEYLREHYQFDRFLNENRVIEFAAFKRAK